MEAHWSWSILKLLAIVGVVMLAIPFVILAERKFIAWMQDRIGPNRVGPWGMLQTIADGIKLFTKEEIVPTQADKWVYLAAPVIAMIPALATFAIIPFGPRAQPTDINVGVLYLLGLSSLGVYGTVLGGWAANSKYSLLGGLRSSAQMLSYELALGVATLCVVMATETLSLHDIVMKQENYAWNLFKPWLWPAAVVFLIGGIAETNRAPFDLPEAETEIVAGFHTEYSGMKFAMFFLGEYAHIVTVSAMATTFFFGGWHGPGASGATLAAAALGIFWFVTKMMILIFGFIWLRATLPRLRYDQLMQFGWTRLLPIGFANVFLLGVWELLQVGR